MEGLRLHINSVCVNGLKKKKKKDLPSFKIFKCERKKKRLQFIVSFTLPNPLRKQNQIKQGGEETGRGNVKNSSFSSGKQPVEHTNKQKNQSNHLFLNITSSWNEAQERFNSKTDQDKWGCNNKLKWDCGKPTWVYGCMYVINVQLSQKHAFAWCNS